MWHLVLHCSQENYIISPEACKWLVDYTCRDFQLAIVDTLDIVGYTCTFFLLLSSVFASYFAPFRYKWQLIRVIQMFTEHVIMKHNDMVPYARMLQFVSN